MKAIWKYPLSAGDVTELHVPRGAQFLDVQMQGDWLQAWAMVEPNADRVLAIVTLAGTGVEYELSGTYFGTVQVGPFVFHAFALVEGS